MGTEVDVGGTILGAGSRGFNHCPNAGIKAITAIQVPIMVAIVASI
jgi:hypothetical protein